MITDDDYKMLDAIYVRKDDCSKNRGDFSSAINEQAQRLVKAETTLSAIKWLCTASLGCAIAELIKLFIG